MAENVRYLRVTAGNLRQSHLYVNGHYDFFPSDIIGSSKRQADGRSIEIVLDGLDQTVATDIGRDAKTGKPRSFLRGRGWVREFYGRHRVQPGTVLAIERLGERKYRLSLDSRVAAVSKRLRAAEFFAGIGLVRLALEANDIDVVFANDIDADKLKMYRLN